jgi:hypothetical protein
VEETTTLETDFLRLFLRVWLGRKRELYEAGKEKERDVNLSHHAKK